MEYPFFMLFVATVCYIHVQARICEVGREKDETNTWMWVSPSDEPCLCTEVILGGISNWNPIQPFQPRLINDVINLQEHYDLPCEQEETRYKLPIKHDITTSIDMLKPHSITPARRTLTAASTKLTPHYSTTPMEVSAVTDLKVCEPHPLGMENGSIPDSSITCSSYQRHDNLYDREPKYARLGSNKIWASDNDDSEPWIQVDLGRSHRITGLLTEGNYGSDLYQYWVEQIEVQIGMSEDNMTFIENDDGEPKVFDANTEPHNVIEILIDPTGILTRFVRIHPLNCMHRGQPWEVCIIRFEILGC